MRKYAILALLASTLLSGCASPEMKMVPAALGDSVGVRFAQGEAVMVSPGKFGDVELLPVRYNRGTGQIIFALAAYNNYNDAINFGPDDVSMRLDDGTPIVVQDDDRQRHQAKNEANAERAEAIGVAAIRIWSAERSSRHDRDRANAMSRGAVDELSDNTVAINARLDSALERIKSLLQTTTIDPGATWGGFVEANQPPLQRGAVRTVEIYVNFIGEQHQFKLLIAPEGTPTPVTDLPAITRASMEHLQITPKTWMWNTPPEPIGATDDDVIPISRF